MLSENLRKYRENKKYSKRQLAKICKINRNTIVDIELGYQKAPNLSTLEKLALALDVSVADLIK